jgi:hypothetical protein
MIIGMHLSVRLFLFQAQIAHVGRLHSGHIASPAPSRGMAEYYQPLIDTTLRVLLHANRLGKSYSHSGVIGAVPSEDFLLVALFRGDAGEIFGGMLLVGKMVAVATSSASLGTISICTCTCLSSRQRFEPSLVEKHPHCPPDR